MEYSYAPRHVFRFHYTPTNERRCMKNNRKKRRNACHYTWDILCGLLFRFPSSMAQKLILKSQRAVSTLWVFHGYVLLRLYAFHMCVCVYAHRKTSAIIYDFIAFDALPIIKLLSSNHMLHLYCMYFVSLPAIDRTQCNICTHNNNMHVSIHQIIIVWSGFVCCICVCVCVSVFHLLFTSTIIRFGHLSTIWRYCSIKQFPRVFEL